MMKTIAKFFVPVSASIFLIACGGGASKVENLINQASSDVEKCAGQGQEKINCVSNIMTKLAQDWAAVTSDIQSMSADEATRITNLYQDLVNKTTKMVMEESANAAPPAPESEPAPVEEPAPEAAPAAPEGEQPAEPATEEAPQ